MFRFLIVVVSLFLQMACSDASKPAPTKVSSCGDRGNYLPCRADDAGMLNDCLPANTVKDWRVFRKSEDQTRIRSVHAWTKCLKAEGCTPLSNYDHAIVQRFTDGLSFDEFGLVKSDYRELASVLTFPELKEVFSSFGIGIRLLSENPCTQRPEVWCI